ncbi:MAG: metallophosphoesterase family protein [Candidatus Omnitrophota bacterium]|nr:metallophosphoesterase family protein [Candidatus Omnitrophota bacterium]
MKHIIISDIHSNLQAFEAVVRSFPESDNKNIICAGDIVGYGADPNVCIDMMISLGARCVLGNHDAASINKTDITYFNEWAKEAVYWTREHLDRSGYGYLETLPYVLEDGSFTMVHGTLHCPEEFMYMDCGARAMHTFEILSTKVCFVGHSHVPGSFILRRGSVYYRSYSERIVLEKDARYIINVGSVGQPRDDDPRACYCIYDSDKDVVEFRRIEYDVETARRRILDEGLPRYLGDRLLNGR